MYTADYRMRAKNWKKQRRMDGANLLQQIWYVELPAIKDIIVIQFILQAGNIMSIGFEKAYAADRYEPAGIRNFIYLCIPDRTIKRRLWIFDSSWTVQLCNQCDFTYFCKLGCKEAE